MVVRREGRRSAGFAAEQGEGEQQADGAHGEDNLGIPIWSRLPGRTFRVSNSSRGRATARPRG
jgi:hypothetical protein